MRGIQHGTGDKKAEKAPALADVPRQGKVGQTAGKAQKPKKKGR